MRVKISQLRNLSIATFTVSIGAVVGGLWAWQLPTEELSARKIIPWQSNVLEVKKPERSAVKLSDMKDSLARPIFRKSRKPFDPSELTQLAAPAVTVTPTPALAPTVVVAAQPAPPPVAEQASAAPEPPVQTAESLQLALRGIYSFDGVWKALFVSPTLPDGEWLAIGSDISGWKLTNVDPNVVTISSGDQKIELKLYVDNQLNALGSHQP
jgi:hypothetical protein